MLDHATTLEVLRDGEIDIVGRIVGSSNNALFVTVTLPCPDPEAGPPRVVEAIHKPTAGERPLDDFPDGTLARREVAAYLVSEATGWTIVPPTLLRDGPFGEGMLQAFVEQDPVVDVVDWINEDHPRLRRMAVFDAAINNTDRKGGHILPVDGGRHVYGVDHGVTFSAVPKLRTVLWGWRGQPLAIDELAGLRRVRDALEGSLATELRGLLTRNEVRAMVRRVDGLLADGRFPLPSPTWPAIPWPPF
ncbi:MAG: SCO1664 family protein [Candidatus Limnocylindrales bacterium]